MAIGLLRLTPSLCVQVRGWPRPSPPPLGRVSEAPRGRPPAGPPRPSAACAQHGSAPSSGTLGCLGLWEGEGHLLREPGQKSSLRCLLSTHSHYTHSHTLTHTQSLMPAHKLQASCCGLCNDHKTPCFLAAQQWQCYSSEGGLSHQVTCSGGQTVWSEHLGLLIFPPSPSHIYTHVSCPITIRPD